jgi:pyruvate, water dikinase
MVTITARRRAPRSGNVSPDPSDFIAHFREVGRESVGRVGGKGANLGEMTRAGFPVPTGFVVTVEAYRRFLEQEALGSRIEDVLSGVDAGSLPALQQASARIAEAIDATPLPEDVRQAIAEAYAALAAEAPERSGGEPFVAARSSATAEDAARTSYAGMFQSFLNVRGMEALVESVKACWASAYGPRVLAYRNEQGAAGGALVAVVVQRMVDSEKSGVLFTVDPASEDPTALVIEAAFGLGEVVVLGQVNPDRYEVDKASRAIRSRAVGHKAFELVRSAETGENERVELDEAAGSARVLADEEVGALAELGVRLEAHYGVPQDAEWAIAGGRVHLVQTRPITTLASAGAPAGADGSGAPAASGRLLVRGLSASPGRASGPVRVLMDAGDAEALEAGDVLVATITTPDWVPVMRRAAAIVTDTGGMTSHAAIVSRELGIPCVVGTREGTAVLRTGAVVTVDGGTGEVTEGAARPEPRGASSTTARAATGWEGAPVTATRLYVNLAEPQRAAEIAALPVDGVGLLRAEFMILEALGGRHPRLLLEEGKGEELVDRMAEGLATFARAFHPRPVIYRAMDFRSNEFRGLEGGERFEPEEANPMIGYRGCFRYTQEPDLFGLELRALARVRRDFPGLHLMLPFVRTDSELRACMRIIDGSELGSDRALERWVMAEVPSVLFRLEAYAALGATGVSIGSNDLTQLMLGVDRDSETLAPLFDERDPAVLAAVERIIRECRRLGITSSICGQAPSVYPDYVEKLVEWGIDSVSVSSDAVAVTRRNLAAAERRVLLRAKREERDP